MLTRPTASSQNLHHAARLSVAPMMDWTDRHCRYLHRLLSQNALLYTEMVTAPALVRGRALHLLDYHPAEHPVALQLGGRTLLNWQRRPNWAPRPDMMKSTSMLDAPLTGYNLVALALF